MEEMI